MRKLRRLFLWILGGAVVLAGIVLLGLNLYVQSQGTHDRIQHELSQRLNTPLHLRQINVTPWGGLKLNGITIPQEQGKIGGDFLRAETFQLRVKFWSLFSDRLVIRQVSLIKPEVVWAQNAAGKWRLPEIPRTKMVATSRLPATIPARSPLPPPAPSSAPATAPPSLPNEIAAARTAPSSDRPFTPEIRRVNLKHGSFTFLDSAGQVVAKFIGLDFNSSFRTATAIKGSATVEKISLRDKFFIENLESPLHYDPAELVFSNISAHAAGGELSGHYEMQLLAEDSPFTANVKFRDLDAARLMTNAGGPAGIIQGRVEGFLDASGKTADPNALAGKGEIVLRDGKVQQYSLLVALGQILQIDELTQLHFEEAEVHYHINPGMVTVDQLLLRSPNIRLSATGTISFKGKLRLTSRLALNDNLRRKLFAPIRDNFQPINDPPGYAAVDFGIGGTVERPKTNLMDKVVGQDLRDLGGVISSLFSGHSKKKKLKEESSPSPTPAEAAPGISPHDTIPQVSATPSSTP